MTLNDIVTIAKKTDLYKIKIQTRTGLIANSLVDQKQINVTQHNQVISLSDITVFGIEKDIPLSTVFENILAFEEGKICSVKPKSSNEELRAFFSSVSEEYDSKKIYPSDIKKIIKWYNILINHNLPELIKEATDNEKKETKPTE